jgi:hypothetical protein
VSRKIDHRYLDPLDAVWIRCAAHIGLRIRRAGDVFAATDGRGTLTLGAASTLDEDDSLAQMILHELCHGLVQGDASLTTPDWGLDNESARDVPREHACLRLQAVLTGEVGLRRVLAPTTEFRLFYDALPEDPLGSGDSSEIDLASAALERSGRSPWDPHLRNALRASAVIVDAVQSLPEADHERERPLTFSLVGSRRVRART